MTRDATLTPVFEEVEAGWVQGRIAEIPSIVTAGRNREEAEVMLRDALREYLRFLRDEGRPLPNGLSVDAEI